jgi:flagellar FliL protein
MADKKEKEQENQENEEKSSGGSKLLLIVIIFLLLLLLIIGGLVAYFLLTGNSKSAPQQPAQVEKKAAVSSMTKMGPIYPLDQFIVNLVSANADRYLKCKIDLELSNAKLQKEINKKLPAIRDMIIQILSSKTVEEIQTAKGKEKLKQEIKTKLNSILTTGEITHVYFTEFVIQ